MTLGATLVTSLLATLAHPMTWLLALAGFLVRGGIVVFLLPIVVLPSPVGLANATAPTVVGFVLGGFTFDLVVLLVLAVGAVLAWIVFGGLLAAALEVEGIRIVAGDDDVVASSRSTYGAITAGVEHAARVGTRPRLRSGPAGAARSWLPGWRSCSRSWPR